MEVWPNTGAEVGCWRILLEGSAERESADNISSGCTMAAGVKREDDADGVGNAEVPEVCITVVGYGVRDLLRLVVSLIDDKARSWRRRLKQERIIDYKV